MYDALPKDSVILLSFTNTQLRDNFSTLEDFCCHFNITQEELTAKLAVLDYTYDSNSHQFI